MWFCVDRGGLCECECLFGPLLRGCIEGRRRDGGKKEE